jgi:transposase
VNRTIGLDIHKRFAEVAVLRPGRPEPQRLRFPAEAQAIRTFAARLGPGDRVALESCTNAFAFHRLLCQHAGEVVVSNPLKTRIIAEAKVKTDKVDAETLARLLAADFLPPVWVPDPHTDALRHLVFHRHGLVQQRTQAKNRIHAVLHRNLIAPTVTDLFGRKGRRFLGSLDLPAHERSLLDADLRVLDFLQLEIAAAERDLARATHDDLQVRRLMTLPGIALTSAAALRAAIGDIARFKTPQRLVSYFGLNPSVHQSGEKAYGGHISRRGRSHARAICVEAAHLLVRVPGPFRAFFERLRRRKPCNVALTAVARKLVVLVWHMLTEGEDYRHAAPALTRSKLSRVRFLATGERAQRGALPGPPPDPTRDHDAASIAQRDYERFIRERYGSQGPQGPEPPRHATQTIAKRKPVKPAPTA